MGRTVTRGAFYAHSSDHLEHKDTWSHSRYQADSNVLEGQWDWEPSEEWGVTVGGAVEEEAFFKEAVATGAAEVDVSRRRHSLLGLFRWMSAEVMELTVAGRLDDYSGFDSRTVRQRKTGVVALTQFFVPPVSPRRRMTCMELGATRT